MSQDCETLLAFRPSGRLAYDLRGAENPRHLLPAVLGTGLHFCMLSLKRKPRSIELISEPIREAAGCIEGIIYGVCRYPGYEFAGSPRTLVVAPVSSAVVERFSSLDSVWQTPWQGWEDWALFTGDKLIGYVCSHEGFGTLYGEHEFFERLGVRATRECGPEDREHRIGCAAPPPLAMPPRWPASRSS